MAVLINTKIKGQIKEGYDQVSVFLHKVVLDAPGFILHCSFETDEGWAVMEVWNSKADADHFFAKNVAPNLPKGIVPKRTYQELHSIVTPL